MRQEKLMKVEKKPQVKQKPCCGSTINQPKVPGKKDKKPGCNK